MLSRKTHLAMAALLRDAKQYLWDGDPTSRAIGAPFVCIAVGRTVELSDGKHSYINQLHIQRWISKQLGAETIYYTRWLKKNVRKFTEEVEAVNNSEGVQAMNKKIQASRLAWMDHMIATLEAP